MPSTPACGYIGDDTGDNISERNGKFLRADGPVLGGAQTWIPIISASCITAATLPAACKSRFARQEVVGSSATRSSAAILATTNVVLPKERHYFIETNYTQYIHAHHEAGPAR
ncbi:hypothetical protein [Gemmiger formicilis]|uniref:hypothetical protein n=1 Tax=Gemmiger formicilis TaxID=745368 RepID=UPI0035230493